jgi:hypothetical protein
MTLLIEPRAKYIGTQAAGRKPFEQLERFEQFEP